MRSPLLLADSATEQRATRLGARLQHRPPPPGLSRAKSRKATRNLLLLKGKKSRILAELALRQARESSPFASLRAEGLGMTSKRKWRKLKHYPLFHELCEAGRGVIRFTG